jgi:hypothetical protein
MIVRAPLTIPDVPMPEIARPMINTLDELATPLIKDPTSKSRKKLRKTTYTFSYMIHARTGDGEPLT